MGARVKRIGGRFYDTGTNNKSFLQVAKDLKTLGIKNYYFMLEIYDYTLVDVDPYSKDLTRDQVARIMTECTRNLWYYLREVCRIPDNGGTGNGIPFKANRGNIAQAWCILHGIDSWLCLPRQQGKTISVIAVQAWAYSFGTTNSNFIFINKDSGNAKENLQRLKDQIDCLPEYLRFEQVLEEDETGNVKVVKAVKNATMMRHPITKNRIIIKSKATSYESALSLARGLTANILHFDEPEFTNYIKTIVENSVSTFETAARNAKANHALYGRIFSCTPGDLDTSMGQESQEILAATTKWTEKLYDMKYDPDNDENNEVLQYVRANGGNGIVYIEYSYQQIGLTDEWLKNISNKIANPLVVKREILLQRLRGSSDSPFEQSDIEYISDIIKPVKEELFIMEHFRFDLYDQLQRNIPYLVSVDCSTGTLSDNNAITILNPYTVEPVGEFKCPYIGETMYEKLLIELVRKYIPRAVVAIERNSVGDGIIDHLLESPIAMNLYYDKAKDIVAENMKDLGSAESMLKKKAGEKKYYGVYTGTQSREDMFTILIRHMSEYKEKFITKNITEDICHLVRTKSGKIEAGSGFHDDSVMSYLIGLYVYYHGNNLARFGIDKGAMDIQNQNQGMSREEVIDRSAYDILPVEEVDKLIEYQNQKEENDFEEIMRRALIQSQSQTFKLGRMNMVDSNIYNSTPENLIDDYESESPIDMDFIDEMNNF